MDFLSDTTYIPVITATSLVVLVLYVYNRQQEGKKMKKHHPITQTMFNQLLNFHRLHDYMIDLATKHKTYRLITPFRNDQATQKHWSVVVVVWRWWFIVVWWLVMMVRMVVVQRWTSG
ncbi:putative abieta-7,13-dien-18-ol hydroxylase [Helianthus anomalus]